MREDNLSSKLGGRFRLCCYWRSLALPATASAHERRTIANGKYDVVVGWDIEPTFVGLKELRLDPHLPGRK